MRRTKRIVVLAGWTVALGILAAAPRARGEEKPSDEKPTAGRARAAPPNAPLRAAHAPHDYAHDRPLLDALAHGFASVEADIFLVDGALLVGHGRLELRPERTLDALYLAPLHERVGRNGGSVWPRADAAPGPVAGAAPAGGQEQRGDVAKSAAIDASEFVLLIDIKADGEATYRALDELLARHAEMLTEVRDGKLIRRAVRIVISGERPVETITAQTVRFAGIDGRLTDIDSSAPSHLMPMVSDHWGRNFSWRGREAMPAAERERLREIVASAHAKGRVVRFWATPELPAFWTELAGARVDLINTDDLSGLARFLRARAAPTEKTAQD